jgi:hypothetical protein
MSLEAPKRDYIAWVAVLVISLVAVNGFFLVVLG